MIDVPGGRSVPLTQIATLSYRGAATDLAPRAPADGDRPGRRRARRRGATVVKQLAPAIAAFRRTLPAGYSVEARWRHRG